MNDIQKKFLRVKKIGIWSEISEIRMPDSKLHGSLINKLSINVAELSVTLVGLLIIGRSDSEYIVFRNEVELLQSLLRRSILKSPHNIKS